MCVLAMRQQVRPPRGNNVMIPEACPEDDIQASNESCSLPASRGFLQSMPWGPPSGGQTSQPWCHNSVGPYHSHPPNSGLLQIKD